jgi:hypothetical protein
MEPNYVKTVHSVSSRPLGMERMASAQVLLSYMHYDKIIAIPTDVTILQSQQYYNKFCVNSSVHSFF